MVIRIQGRKKRYSGNGETKSKALRIGSVLSALHLSFSIKLKCIYSAPNIKRPLQNQNIDNSKYHIFWLNTNDQIQDTIGNICMVFIIDLVYQHSHFCNLRPLCCTFSLLRPQRGCFRGHYGLPLAPKPEQLQRHCGLISTTLILSIRKH